MRNILCCWCNKNSDEFETHVPLRFSGKRNRALNFDGTIDVLFLSGYERLGEKYLRELKELGYQVHDAGKAYLDVAKAYPVLDRFGDYEKKCFLRWLVISSLFPGESIVHYDGDVVFNEAPDVIANRLSGRTFVLQGCPALTAIADREWFTRYEAELSLFAGDIPGYSEKAWKERQGWEVSEREKWAGQRSREIISSDQDLLSHLIHTDRIVQDRPRELLQDLQSYVVFENPLYLHGYENNLSHARYERVSGLDYIDGKRVLIWHLQSDFNHYLSRFIFRRKYLRRGLKRLSNDPAARDLEYRLYRFFIDNLHADTGKRLTIYRYFFEDHDFSEVLTDRTWWHAGAFA